MSTLRISDAPLLPDVNGSEKIPTGGRGDLAISMEQVKTFAQGGLPQQINAHVNNTENPHSVTKAQVGLGDVNNTSDVNKPISTATQEALDLKADKTAVHSKSVTLPTYYTKEAGVHPVIGVADGAYFNVRSTDQGVMLVEYQNIGGSAVATGKSYLSALGVQQQEKPASTIKDASGKDQQEINDFTREKTLDLLNFFTDAEILAYRSDYTSVDIAEAWQRAVTEANTLNQKLTAFGRFRSASTLVLNSHADLSCMILESSATSIAIDVRANDYDYLSRKNIVIGEVINLNKSYADNWASTTATGIRTVNLNRCFIKFNRIQGFAVGLHEYAQGQKGSAYNSYELGQFDNNKVQHLISTEDVASISSISWVNQNKHEGGSYSHLTSEGANVPDCHHLYIKPGLATPNANVFNNPSFENFTCDFHVVNGGRWNTINEARWEVIDGTPKVKYICLTGSPSVANHGTRNKILGGYEAELISFSYSGTGSSFNNVLDAQSRGLFELDTNSGGHRYTNRYASGQPVFSLYPASTTKRLSEYTANEYTISLSSRYFRAKKTTDEFARIEIDSENGYLKLGSGVSDVSYATLYGTSTEFYVNRSFIPVTADTQDIGKPSAKWKNIHLSGSVGFFGSIPPTTKRSITGKKTPTTIAEQNAVIDSIILALATYGIVSDDRTT